MPFINRSALGGVTGIVGAGGNVGGVAAGLLLRNLGSVPTCLWILGWAAIVCAVGAAMIRFSIAHKEKEQALYEEAVLQRTTMAEPGLAAAA